VATHLRIADTRARGRFRWSVGILAWGGLYLRDSRIRQLVSVPPVGVSGIDGIWNFQDENMKKLDASQDQSASGLHLR
jgi:hypothetical protein